MMPDTFNRIELWRVGREIVHVKPITIMAEPSPHIFVLMIGCVVLNQNDWTGVIRRRDLLKKCQIRVGIEHLVTMIHETCGKQFDPSEDFHAFALASDRNFGLTALARPRAVQCGILSETGLVFEDQGRVLGTGFFFRFGYVYRFQRSCLPGSALANIRLGR